MRTKSGQGYFAQTSAMLFLPLLFGFFNPCFSGAAPDSAFHFPHSAFKIRTVVIDPGHGGKDPGCGGQFSHEKDNALAVAMNLGAKIEASFPQVKVVYTRSTDVFIPLIERARIANEAKADLFISIHCNSLPVKKSEIAGTEVYVLGLHVAERNLEVAKRENEAILLEKDHEKNYSNFDPDSPEGTIFISAWQSAYLEQSIAFASLVNEGVGRSGRLGRGVKQAGFMVLKETACPSVLIETAYLTSDEDENYIATADGQADMAGVILTAFSNWKTQMEGGTVAARKGEVSKKQVKVEPRQLAAAPRKVVGEEANNGRASGRDSRAEAKPIVNSHPKKVDSEEFRDTQIGGSPFKILLTTSAKKLNPKKDPLATVGAVEEQKINGQWRYFATGFSSRNEAKKALPELRGLGFPDAKLVD